MSRLGTGVPIVVVGAGATGNRTVPASSVRHIVFPETMEVQLSCDTTGACRLWFADPVADPNARYIVIRAGTGYTGKCRVREIWVQGDTVDTTIDLVVLVP